MEANPISTSGKELQISNLDNIPNKLIVNFESKGINAVEYVSKVQELDSNNKHGLRKDPTADENIRYTGAEPRNYVQFGNDGELWRIIGIFNVKDKRGFFFKDKQPSPKNKPKSLINSGVIII